MKRFKTKKRKNIKRNVVIIITGIIILILFIIISLQKLNSSYYNVINLLLENANFDYKKRSLLINKLSSNLDYFLKTPVFNSKSNFVMSNNTNKVYIYNTHDTEKYVDGKSVYDASKLLQSNLKKLGIDSIVEDKKTSDYINTGLNYYDISRKFLTNAINNNILYYIDIHRDTVNDTKIIINNKKYAKILFVLGKDNPHYKENKKVIEEMNNYLEKNYKGISKGILEKSESDVNGIYNQDLNKNIFLIEVGGVKNNIEEVNNSTEIIALMLYHMIGDRNEESIKN